MEHNQLDKQYNEVANNVLHNGHVKEDRTGTGTISYFDSTIRFNMFNGEFPLLTGKFVPFKTMTHELLWFLGSYDEKYKRFGNTNLRYLVDHNCNIWNEWPYEKYESSYTFSSNPNAYKDYNPVQGKMNMEEYVERIKTDDGFALSYGDLGPVYGKQWTEWTTFNMKNIGTKLTGPDLKPDNINQIEQVIDQLKNNPDSRRIMVNAWNVAEIDQMALPPCHYGFQFWTRDLTITERIKLAGKKLGKSEHYFEDFDDVDLDVHVGRKSVSLKFTMRSIDVGLGLPFNIASYGLLLHMIGHIVNMEPETLIWSGGDVHIYSNHTDQIKEQLRRTPKPLPRFKINRKVESITDFRIEDFDLIDYDPHPHIKMDIAV